MYSIQLECVSRAFAPDLYRARCARAARFYFGEMCGLFLFCGMKDVRAAVVESINGFICCFKSSNFVEEEVCGRSRLNGWLRAAACRVYIGDGLNRASGMRMYFMRAFEYL